MKELIAAYIRYKNSIVLAAITDDSTERESIMAMGAIYKSKLTPGLIALAESAAEKVTANI